jgi:hypothetical protein
MFGQRRGTWAEVIGGGTIGAMMWGPAEERGLDVVSAGAIWAGWGVECLLRLFAQVRLRHAGPSGAT